MSAISATGEFYQRIISFPEFFEFTDDRHFSAVPENWTVIITDVKGSTKAIEAGRYKDVNTIGAATISTVEEAIHREFPYVFGGDGATLLLPPADLEAAYDALCGLRRLSLENFEIELRIGSVAVKEIYEAGGQIRVAKHELAAGKCIALFRGGGLQLAETLIKDQEERYCLSDRGSDPAELSGLTCRWQPIENRRGNVVSLLVQAREDDARTYTDFLTELRKIYRGNLEQSNPVNIEHMSYGKASDMWRKERRHYGTGLSWLHLYKFILSFIFLGLRIGKRFWDFDTYIRSLKSHADHRKFDDMLRMVIDCSEPEREQIESLLRKMKDDNRIFYGTHRSDNALMTCYVQNTSNGNHIHFIDGDDGGYAMAAKELKAQIKAFG